MKYWQWLFKGYKNEEPGIKRFYNRWLILHVLIGLFMSFLTPLPIYDAADTILVPLSMIFVAFVFVWLALQNMLQTNKMAELLHAHPRSYQKYICVYQTAILMFLITLCAWAGGDLHIYDELFGRSIFCFLIKVILFAMVSLTIRECWHLVLGVAKLSLLNYPKQEE